MLLRPFPGQIRETSYHSKYKKTMQSDCYAQRTEGRKRYTQCLYDSVQDMKIQDVLVRD